MRILYKKIPKVYISTLPRFIYDGPICIIESQDTVDEAIKIINGVSIIGIDTETKPSFRKGVINPVALLQIATEDKCFLFRLNKIGFVNPIMEILVNPLITKVGISLKDDFERLHQRKFFQEKNCIDLQHEIINLGIEDKSLQKIFANLFAKKISKSSRLTNWENVVLSPSQQHYAALDAYSCLLIYKEYISLKKTRNYQLLSEPIIANQNV